MDTNLRISLRDKNNGTFRGKLVLKNWTLLHGDRNVPLMGHQITTSAAPTDLNDPVGASYYVIAVVLVYGMSIVALIASHIKRKHGKLIEDRQINKYLREFQTVKEKQSRESYKNLKKRIKEQINWEKTPTKTQLTLHQNLSHALLPMIALGVNVPQLQPSSSIPDIYLQRSRSGSVFNSQTSIGPPRSRTSSVGSYASVCSMPPMHSSQTTDGSPASLPRDRHHERKRGLANLMANTTSNSDYPLEKILEESIDSRASSFRRKGSKRSKMSSSGGSLDQSGSGKGVHFNDLSSSGGGGFSPELPDISGGTSELGSSVEHIDYQFLGQSLGDSGNGSTTQDHEATSPSPPYQKHKLEGQPQADDIIPGVHNDVIVHRHYNNISPPRTPKLKRVPQNFHLDIPQSHAGYDDDVWVPSSGSPSDLDSGLYNGGFRHSPSPSKSRSYSTGEHSPLNISRGPSPRGGNSPVQVVAMDTLYSDVTDHSDSEAELLHITCL